MKNYSVKALNIHGVNRKIKFSSQLKASSPYFVGLFFDTDLDWNKGI